MFTEIEPKDILKIVRVGKSRRIKISYSILIASIAFPPLAVIAIALLWRIGIYRYHKDTHHRVCYIKRISLIYLFLSVICYFFAGSVIVISFAAKVWLLFELYRLGFVYKTMPFVESDISFARKAHFYMMKNNESKLVKEFLELGAIFK